MNKFATTIRPPKFKINIIAILGDYFKYDFTWRSNPNNIEVTPQNQNRDDLFPIIDVTGMTALLQIKDTPTDATSKLEFTEISGITLDGSNSPNITWEITASQITTLGVGRYVYELQMTDLSLNPITIIGGYLTIEQDVTR